MEKTLLPPKPFLWRRLHSIAGVWISLFLIQHLLANSQAALLVGDDGRGFIHDVNWIASLPYLPLIEAFLLGVPILIHMVWGIAYLRTGKLNSFRSDGTTPALGEYSRNQAYSWQRITSWILLIGLVGHIVQMRFLEHPTYAQVGDKQFYMIRVTDDSGLATLGARLGFEMFDAARIREERKLLERGGTEAETGLEQQKRDQKEEWVKAMEKWKLGGGQVVAVAPDFGTAELLLVRDTFKMPMMMALYTVFVLSACYHGFNGLWTFMITWGVTLTETSQRLMRRVATGLMVIVSFLGLAAIWGTYWINLKY